MKNILKTLDPVLAVAWVLAIASAFFVHPDAKYSSYIDLRTLGILWALMVVVKGLEKNQVFEILAKKLIHKVHSAYQLALVLIGLCFFSSMFITNDVSLITFVPFAILILNECELKEMILPVVVFQTVAANLGSMLTPIGNPQNLYLYGVMKISVLDFVKILLPYTLASLVIIVVFSLFLPKKKEKLVLHRRSNHDVCEAEMPVQSDINLLHIGIYSALFVISLLAVGRIIPYYVAAAAVLAVVLVLDREVISRADYILLLTFVGFFIFTGNMARIESVHSFLSEIIEGRVLLVSVISSQFISNVPSALLLSDFTNNYKELLLGVNFGGLGTLIASMASLISYKEFGNEFPQEKAKYLLYFTFVNVVFLFALMIVKMTSWF